MRDSDRISRLFAWFVAIVLSCGLCGLGHGGEEAGQGALTANMIPSVGSYPRDDLSGSMALHALHSVLRTQGISGTYSELIGISGSVFKVVYDSSDAFEPLRDTCPFDLLRTAAARSGFADAHWETELTGEALKQIVKREIDTGRPLVSPFLKPDDHHGFNIITGYDYKQNHFKIQGPFNRRRPQTIPIPEKWDGPTLSPKGWAVNPVFVLGEASYDSAAMGDVYADMADQAIELLRGGKVSYGSAEGEAQYMARPGPHQASYGLPAYDILVWDVEYSDITVAGEGGPSLNFAFLWRIDALVGLLEHDRMRGPEFASLLTGVVSQRQASAQNQLEINFQRTAEDAAALRDLFWHEVPDSLNDPAAVLEYTEGKDAIVFALTSRDGLAASLRDMGRDIYECPWGWVMVEDSPAKRLQAKMKVISIRSRDLKCLDIMETMADEIGRMHHRRWPPSKWRPRRLRQG